MREDTSGVGRTVAGRNCRRAVGMVGLAILAVMMNLTAAVAQVPDMASITVVLDAVPDDDQDFEFTTSGGPLPASFLLDDDGSFAGSPDPGTLDNAWTSGLVPAGATYSIAQTAVAGWSLLNATCDNGDAPGSITPDTGVNVTCTFTNEADPGAITVTKSVEILDGSAWSFEITVDPVDPGVTSPQIVFGTGSGSDVVTFEPLTLNQTYTINEPILPGGWEQTSFTCAVADENPAASGYQVTIPEAGQDVACEIANRTVAAITVIVDAVPDDDQDFEFTTSGGPLPASFLLDDDESFAGSPDPGTLDNAWTSGLVPSGATYSIAQTAVPGWSLLIASCDNGDAPGSITPDTGANVTCTFVNEADPGTITVTKSVTGLRQPWVAVLILLLLLTGFILHRSGRATTLPAFRKR